MYNGIIIFKPDFYDSSLRIHPLDALGTDLALPDEETVVGELTHGLVSNIGAVVRFIWSEQQVRAMYNQAHHLEVDIYYNQIRVERVVHLYANRLASMYVFEFDVDQNINILRDRMKIFRKRYLKDPDNGYYTLLHISDSPEEGEREMRIYEDLFN